MEILNNPWFVGIGAGILSGLVVAYISRLIFSRRDSKEYAQKLSLANHEVLYAVRPGVSEGVIPTNIVLKSLISATARKYSVDEKDMHDLDDISSELIKEVMDSSFISASAKNDFCEKLTKIKEEAPLIEKAEFEKEFEMYTRYRKQMVSLLSGTVAILTGLAAMLLSLKTSTIFEPKNIIILLVPALVAILVAFVGVMARELQKMKLKSFNVRVAGLNAEFKPNKEESEKNS